MRGFANLTSLIKSKVHDHNCLHVQIQKVLSEGVQLRLFFFLVDEGREDQNTPKSGPSLEWMAFRSPNIESWLSSFAIFMGSRPVLLRNPIFL